jgi:hypothetical protein
MNKLKATTEKKIGNGATIGGLFINFSDGCCYPFCPRSVNRKEENEALQNARGAWNCSKQERSGRRAIATKELKEPQGKKPKCHADQEQD